MQLQTTIDFKMKHIQIGQVQYPC